MLVNEFLQISADRFPEKTALIYQNERLTYSEVETKSNQLANALIQLGFKKQERAALYLENSTVSVFSLFAVLKAGGVFMVVNPKTKSQKVEYVLNDSQASVIITDERRLSEILSILNSCPYLKYICIADIQREITPVLNIKNKKLLSLIDIMKDTISSQPEKRCIDIDLASLIYTSGSTGFPKGAMLTHQNMVAAANSIIEYLENTDEDIVINILPLSFDYGLYQVLMTFKFGGTLVLEKNLLYLYKVIEKIVKEKVTGFPLVPTIATMLLRLRSIEECDFSALRYITSTGQALHTSNIEGLQRLFPTTKIYSMFGLTECKRVSFLDPEELKQRPLSVGKAMPNVEVYLVDKNGRKIADSCGKGELVVRGANVMKGYWNLPEETESALKPGPLPGEKVLFTGDLFKMDEEGYLYFMRRKDDIINCAGEKVSPKEIENIIHEIDGVVDVAVIGVKDKVLGESIKAYVILKEESMINEEIIIKHCAKHLEGYMVPSSIEFRSELPKSLHGKTDKAAL